MVVRQKGDECLILSKPCPAFDAHLDDRNYVYATASITFWRWEKERGGRERAHDTRRLLYAAGIFIPKTECNFFFWWASKCSWCSFFLLFWFAVIGWTTRNQIFCLEYSRIIFVPTEKYLNIVFSRYFCKTIYQCCETIKKCVCNVRAAVAEHALVFRILDEFERWT